jgi:hypothetical protein
MFFFKVIMFVCVGGVLKIIIFVSTLSCSSAFKSAKKLLHKGCEQYHIMVRAHFVQPGTPCQITLALSLLGLHSGMFFLLQVPEEIE